MNSVQLRALRASVVKKTTEAQSTRRNTENKFSHVKENFIFGLQARSHQVLCANKCLHQRDFKKIIRRESYLLNCIYPIDQPIEPFITGSFIVHSKAMPAFWI